jgi:L-alanine-DL-glutamate epimerase-like enolase superfamily enzyme
MMLDSIQASALAIPFKTAFKHAAAERAATQSLFVHARARSGALGFGEGCPREYVTGESLKSGLAFVSTHLQDWLAAIRDVRTLGEWGARNRAAIDANPAAWAAVELALLDLLGNEEGRSVEALLGLPELAGRYRYTAVLGDAGPAQFEAQLAAYVQAGMRDFKIKLSGDLTRDLAKVRALAAAHIAPQAVRVDANNLWADAGAAIAHLEALGLGFFALEEPLRAGDFAGMRSIAEKLNVKIILDESLARSEQLACLEDSVECWIVNLRVSKMGGLLRSLDVAREVRERGLSIIVGAHVGETSLLTRAALTVAHGARDILVAQEGAFGTHLLTRDVVDPPLMFGAAGVLDADALGIGGRPGLGLAVTL